MEIRIMVTFNRDLARLRDRQLALQVNEVIDDLKAAFQVTEVDGVRHLAGVDSRYRIMIRNYPLVFLMEGTIAYLNWSQGGIYIFGVMKISLSDLVKTLLPYLYDDLVPTPDLRHMRISPWL